MVRTNMQELRLQNIAARGETVDRYRLMDPRFQLFNHRDPVALANLELYAEIMEMREGHYYDRLCCVLDHQEHERSAFHDDGTKTRECVLSLTLTIVATLLLLPKQLLVKALRLVPGRQDPVPS